MTEISNYAKYRVSGPGAEAWLSSLLTARMPAAGRITLTAMLNDAGRIVGEFTVARPTEADDYHLFGSLPAEVHHSRWFRHHLPADGSRRVRGAGARADRACPSPGRGRATCWPRWRPTSTSRPRPSRS